MTELARSLALVSDPRPPMTAPTLELARLVVEAALQPIVEIHSGDVFGYEALLRGHDRLGFASPVDLLDHMHLAGALSPMESLVRQRAFGRFGPLAAGRPRSIFLNLDRRLIGDPDATIDALLADLDIWRIPPTAVAIELSERHDNTRSPYFPRLLERLRSHGIRIALDDFGIGHSELKLLCDYGLDFIKIDRHFVSGMASNARRRLFVATLTDLAHVLGVRVIAEGVETEDEYFACVEAGCDLVQGYFVARPTVGTEDLPDSYPDVSEARGRLRRAGRSDEFLVRSEMQVLPTIRYGCKLDTVFDLFGRNPTQTFFPVVDDADVPVGIIHERDLKGLIYSDYGRDLVRNKGFRPTFSRFVTPAPIADIGLTAERLLEIFATAGTCDAVLLTENMRYAGVFSSTSLLKVMNEKKVRAAHDLNPLTELPGNAAITDFLERVVADAARVRTLCYFDFDHFKAFNDAYGFARGDKAILLFARMMRERLTGGERFVGHVGGDDFFAAAFDEPRESFEPVIRSLLADFASEVAQLYEAEDRAAGAIIARDRNGNLVRDALMRCSVAVLECGPGWTASGSDGIGHDLAAEKRRAKGSADGLSWSCLDAAPR